MWLQLRPLSSHSHISIRHLAGFLHVGSTSNDFLPSIYSNCLCCSDKNSTLPCRQRWHSIIKRSALLSSLMMSRSLRNQRQDTMLHGNCTGSFMAFSFQLFWLSSYGVAQGRSLTALLVQASKEFIVNVPTPFTYSLNLTLDSAAVEPCGLLSQGLWSCDLRERRVFITIQRPAKARTRPSLGRNSEPWEPLIIPNWRGRNANFLTETIEDSLVLVDKDAMNALGQPIHNAKRYGDKYFAYIDVFHQLHCLDLVRKYIFRDYYPSYIAFQDTEERILFHVGE